MSNPEDIGTFHGAEVNFSDEYHEARRLMGTVGTDMEKLLSNVTFLYLNAPNDKWANAYMMLIEEIRMRSEMLATL